MGLNMNNGNIREHCRASIPKQRLCPWRIVAIQKQPSSQGVWDTLITIINVIINEKRVQIISVYFATIVSTIEVITLCWLCHTGAIMVLSSVSQFRHECDTVVVSFYNRSATVVPQWCHMRAKLLFRLSHRCANIVQRWCHGCATSTPWCRVTVDLQRYHNECITKNL